MSQSSVNVQRHLVRRARKHRKMREKSVTVTNYAWIYGREHDDPMDDLDVTMAIEGIFLKTSLRAAVRLGQDHEANLRYVQNHFWVSVGL